MSDTEPDFRERDTLPPEDSDPVRLMRDLRGAIVNMGEKMAALELYLLRQELAIVTEEAQTHRANERLDSHEDRLRALESRFPEAAE